MNITIPSTAEAAVAALDDPTALLASATEWTRAVLVLALVGYDSKPGPKGSMETHGSHTINSLSKLRITGLRDINTVRRYRDDAYAALGYVPQLGEEVKLPTDDWCDRQSNGSGAKNHGGKYGSNNINVVENIAAKAGKNPDYGAEVFRQTTQALSPAQREELVAEAVRADPKLAEAAVKAAAESAHPVLGRKPALSPENRAMVDKLRAANAASDLNDLLSEARDLLKRYARERGEHRADGLDTAHALAVLKEIIVQAETLRMEISLDAGAGADAEENAR